MTSISEDWHISDIQQISDDWHISDVQHISDYKNSMLPAACQH
jgi:hypothetical protein